MLRLGPGRDLDQPVLKQGEPSGLLPPTVETTKSVPSAVAWKRANDGVSASPSPPVDRVVRRMTRPRSTSACSSVVTIFRPGKKRSRSTPEMFVFR